MIQILRKAVVTITMLSSGMKFSLKIWLSNGQLREKFPRRL